MTSLRCQSMVKLILFNGALTPRCALLGDGERVASGWSPWAKMQMQKLHLRNGKWSGAAGHRAQAGSQERRPERRVRAVQGGAVTLCSTVASLVGRQGRVRHGFEHRTKIRSGDIHAGV